jgi:hypothetical protein
LQDCEEICLDATCYESDLRYPIDVKLLWECCEWLKKQIDLVCHGYHLAQPRNKFLEQCLKQLAYRRRKKPTHRQTQARIKSLLYLPDKLKTQLDPLIAQVPLTDLKIWARYFSCIHTVEKVYEQQRYKYQTGQHPSERIVSLDKDYLRPIVRGKENKRVEFGAKVHMLQVDGINFIEHFSYEAFHEGNRLLFAMDFHEQLMEVKCQ